MVMQTLRNQIRPKHQVLVLKCYPRHQKNNVELKPNSSELSYLLYYASTRRSKLQKVADFLDKRVISDVWNVRIGKVSVTLQILRALIEKCPRDLPLYAAATLRIFKTILNSLDVTMIEESVPTWAAFCAHQDPAVLAADQDYIRQYEEIVRLYASFASKDTPVQHKSAKSLPVRMRFRKAGLSAIRALAESDSLATETSRQLSVIVPVILENIYADQGHYLTTLEHKEEEKHETEKELVLRRRMSTVVPQKNESTPDPVAASGSLEAADRLAEQEIAVIALQALKKTFAVVPRSQLRLATIEVLKFMGQRIDPQQHFPAATVIPLQSGSWPCMLFGMICGWAPVQDRHVILVTAVEQLTNSEARHLREEDYERQYILATITGWLLSSDVNFIGLSVMDVLVGLIKHILALLETPSKIVSTEKDNNGNGADMDTEKYASPDEEHKEFEGSYPAHASKIQLISQLSRCIGCLAVHVYYSDQISDMISAILVKIKPAEQVFVAATLTEGTQVNGGTSVNSLTEKRPGDGYFSYDKARLAALRAIKEIIIWANWTRPDGVSNSSSRNPIPIERWDGSHWLLRESCWEVRVAYVDVLLTWMQHELKKGDLRVKEDTTRRPISVKPERKDMSQKEANLARRAVSNASQREMSPHRSKSTFLPLIHLAIYDNAHQFAPSERDILLLHLLLTNMVARLGVNGLQHGLPMIRRLQEDISDFDDVESQIHIASLVHGYLWAVSVYFHFDASATGRQVALDISQRMKNETWLHGIRMPPMPIEEVVQRSASTALDRSPEAPQDVQISPFDKFEVLVDKVAEGYEASLYSPPTSPPTSPSRKFSTPVLEQATMGPPARRFPNQLPATVREFMGGDWTREAVIAATARTNDSHSGSLSGSPTANGSGKHLTVNPTLPTTSNGDMTSPRRSHAHTNLHVPHSRSGRPSSGYHSFRDPQRPLSFREGFHVNAAMHPRSRRGSQSGTPLTTSSSVRSSIRVEDLKRVLSGQVPLGTSSLTRRQDDAEREDSASESMMSYEGSEISNVQVDDDYAPIAHNSSGGLTVRHGRADSESSAKDFHTEGSVTPRPLTSNSTLSPPSSSRRSSISPEPEVSEIPPVPPLPESYASMSPPRTSSSSLRPNSPPRGIAITNTINASGRPASKAESIKSLNVRQSLRRSISTRDGQQSTWKQSGNHDIGKHTWSAMDLLDSIESDGIGPVPGTGNGRVGGALKPPY
ncbi:hypothetical protein BT63DRAFT_471563 [Microthyrium microscopicum]|uniref:Protein EFR3 n=1 Tax=Microthyrium microscopicum TaxID=703497 RepID=A0A6A6UAE6_9PEZI|nr:hypothetical protein BT63DRAFT_471563 [Microthyrium microscopicum]